jgi:autotransporter-associated beta strand protein
MKNNYIEKRNVMRRILLFSFFVWTAVNLMAQTSYTWVNTSGGNQFWNEGDSWLGGVVPNPLAGDTVNFTADIEAHTAIAMGGNRTVGTLNLGKDTVNFRYNFSNNNWIFRANADTTLGTATVNINGGNQVHWIQGNIDLLVENLVVNNNAVGGGVHFMRTLWDNDGDDTRSPNLTVNGVPGSGPVLLNSTNATSYSGFKHLVINDAEVGVVGKQVDGVVNDVWLGMNLTEETPDAITLNGGTLSNFQDATFLISANRGITLTEKGGTIVCNGGGRDWVVNSIITGTGALNVDISGASTVTLNAANTYSGNTSITDKGTLKLGADGSINNSPHISIAGGATFDVSAIANYTLGASTTLSAAGYFAYPATIKADAATGVNFGSQNIDLTYTLPPVSTLKSVALTISEGALTLNNNAISVNNANDAPLGIGTYPLIEVVSGTITGTPNASVTVTGNGIANGTAAFISVSDGSVFLEVIKITPYTWVNTAGGQQYWNEGDSWLMGVAPNPVAGDTVNFTADIVGHTESLWVVTEP